MIKTRMSVCMLLFFALTCSKGYTQSDSLINLSGEKSWDSSSTYNLLFQVQQKRKSTAAITEIYTPQLLKTVSTPIAGTFTGRIAGLVIRQQTGEPSNDDASLSLRGQAPLVIIDGIPQSFVSINPEQIESVTVLKDAVSTAMYGIRSSGGIIQLTTKKGAVGKQTIRFNAMGGFSKPTYMPKTLDAYNYALLYNEALVNDGKNSIYSQADLDAYRAGNDTFGHPNVNWQDQLLRKSTAYSRYDLEITGGTKTARYYVSLDYLDQPGLFKTADSAAYNTNSDYKRYIFRSNVQVDLTRVFSTSLNLFGRIQNSNQPGVTTATLYNNIIRTPANAYPIYNSNGSFGGSQDFRSNNYAANYNSGYRPSYERDFRVDLTVKANLDDLVKGLWLKGTAAVNAYLQQNFNRSKNVVVFQQGIGTDGKPTYTQFGTTNDQQNAVLAGSQNRMFYTEVAAGYSNNFGKNHLDVLAIANNDYRMVNTDLPFNVRGISGKVSYDYANKYLAEIAMGYSGSDRYRPGHQYGAFPAVGLGWNIAEEDFAKTDWLNVLKLRASYGRTGSNANAGYYAYNQYYTFNANYNFGTTPTVAPTIGVDVLANPNLTWEKANKFNVGIDAAFFNNKLQFTAEYFVNKYYDLLQLVGNNTSITGATYAVQNLGSNRYSGPELQLTWQDKKGSFSYVISPNIALLKSQVLFQDEVTYQNAYQQRTGQPLGAIFGYVADGLYNSSAEINASPRLSNSALVPGDIRYKDLNGDGKIDANDQTVIGANKPQINYGINAGLSFKGFDLTALLQGAYNRNIYTSGAYLFAFTGNGGRGQAYAANLDRWTPQTTATASMPRLTTGPNYNNDQVSSYWVKNGNFLRLKSIELGYSLPQNFIKRAHLSTARFYINGTNLLTFSKLDGVDPENFNNLYPIQKLVMAGVNIQF